MLGRPTATKARTSSVCTYPCGANRFQTCFRYLEPSCASGRFPSELVTDYRMIGSRGWVRQGRKGALHGVPPFEGIRDRPAPHTRESSFSWPQPTFERDMWQVEREP